MSDTENEKIVSVTQGQRGFVVTDRRSSPPHNFAFTTLDEALSFVREHFGVEEKPERCEATSDCYRCDRDAGHEGEHRQFDCHWLSDEEPKPKCVHGTGPRACCREEGHEGKHRAEWV